MLPKHAATPFWPLILIIPTKKRPAGRFELEAFAASYFFSDEVVPVSLSDVAESPEVESFFLLFFDFLVSSVSSVADVPLLLELVSDDAASALPAGPPEPVIPVLPVASCDGMTVGEEDMSAPLPPLAPLAPLVPLLPELVSEDAVPALLAGPPEPVIPVLPVASWDGMTVGEDDMSAPLPPLEPLAPLVPLLPELVSDDTVPALLAGPPEPVIPVLPVVFWDGITVGDEDVLLPEVASVAVACASTTEDAEATITNDNERSVVFNAMCSSLRKVESILDAETWRETQAGAFIRRDRGRRGSEGKLLNCLHFLQCKIV